MIQWTETVHGKFIRMDQIVRLEVSTYSEAKHTSVRLEAHTQDRDRHILRWIDVPNGDDYQTVQQSMRNTIVQFMMAAFDPDPFAACYFSDGKVLKISKDES